jgi:glycosyltransferase involved in cell wall biosynthesis
MRVAYLVNQYPHVSHTFIRREIAALEAAGVEVERFSVRPSAEELVDPADRNERLRTQVLLDAGFAGLLFALTAMAFRRPLTWLRALGAAVRLGRRSGRGVLRHLAYFAEACVLVRRLRRRGVRRLHAHFGTNSAAVAMLASMLGGPPYSFTVHGPEEFDCPESISLREKVARSVGVVVVSDFGRSQLLRWAAQEDWPKVRVVRCGLDAAFLVGGPQPIPEAPRLVCVGRLAEQKGQLLLLEALAHVAAEGIDFEMRLAGDGPLRAALEDRVRVLGLGERVRITGWLSGEAVRQELLDARLMVLPSFAEGLPVVLMEALALGRPVVSTYIAGIPELVENGVNGWLVPAGSVTALADALAKALRAPTETLARIVRVGAARAAALHSASHEAAKLAEMFRAAPAARGAALADPLSGEKSARKHAPAETLPMRQPLAGASE